jgi:hypothetical protein
MYENVAKALLLSDHFNVLIRFFKSSGLECVDLTITKTKGLYTDVTTLK